MANAQGLRNLMENTRRLEREDMYWHAFRRLCALEGLHFDDPLERDSYDVLNADEEIRTEKHGRTTEASRMTRPVHDLSSYQPHGRTIDKKHANSAALVTSHAQSVSI